MSSGSKLSGPVKAVIAHFEKEVTPQKMKERVNPTSTPSSGNRSAPSSIVNKQGLEESAIAAMYGLSPPRKMKAAAAAGGDGVMVAAGGGGGMLDLFSPQKVDLCSPASTMRGPPSPMPIADGASIDLLSQSQERRRECKHAAFYQE